MLQDIRDRLTGPFVWVIVGIIVVPFAFFGIETFRSGGGDPAVAKVGGQKITESQLRRGTDQRLAQLQQLMGENFRQDLIDTKRFRQSVLDDMTQELMLRQHVKDNGYRAADAAIFEAVSVIPAFQEDGKFSTEAYRARLAQQGYTPARFEAQLRDSLVIDQMREGVVSSGVVTHSGAAQAYRLSEQQRWLAYSVFDAARYLPKVKVSDEQVQARYEEQKSRFQSPERLRVAYVELALPELPEAPVPGAEVLKALYEADKATRFSTIEERRARHILINFGADKNAARERIAGLADKIAKGADFASLAGSQSDDPGSKAQRGDLGWIKRGQMLEKFEQALFALDVGQVSEPVETEFGWHLIKLEELRAARVQAFDDVGVQAELLKLYRQRDAERRYQEMSEKLEQLAFESPGSLDTVVKELGLVLKTSDWLTRSAGTGLFANAALREAGFSADVLTNGENSKPLPAGDNRVVVLRKQDYEAPRQKALEEVADAVRDELKTATARQQAEAGAADALKGLNEGRALEQVAREKAVELKAPGLTKRNATGVDGKILEALFRLPRAETGKTAWTQVKLANGDMVVLGAASVQDADFSVAPEADQQRELARLREATAGAEFAAYRADLQKRIEIKLIEQAEVPETEPAK